MIPSRYLDRDKVILQISAGKRVLHLGCVGNTDLSQEERVKLASQSLHSKLTKMADTIGIDSSDDVIAEYRLLGIFENIVSGDVEHLENVAVEGTFDVVVAGDIIEHVSNPGAMLTGIRRFCHDNTQLVITTPHAFGLMLHPCNAL